MTVKSAKIIKSALRVLEVLEYFDQSHPSSTVMDIARTLGYPQSSTSELLQCLVTLGYLQYDRYTRVYSPSIRVGLIGAWVEPDLFRDGLLLSTIDTIAKATGHTVVLSLVSNFRVQHVHVAAGSKPGSIPVHINDTDSLLHSIVGKILLTTYPQAYILAAVRRLNAEESKRELRVQVPAMLKELEQLSVCGWGFEVNRETGHGAVVAMIPAQQGSQRIAISVVASADIINNQVDDIYDVIMCSNLCRGNPTPLEKKSKPEFVPYKKSGQPLHA